MAIAPWYQPDTAVATGKGRAYHSAMAFAEVLAERIRELLGDQPDVTEKKMFGGLAFLVGGNMAISASGKGGVLVRADPADPDRLLERTSAELAVMRGRPMEGWLRVSAADIRTRRQLARWVGVGTAYARSLPAKAGTR